MAQSKRVTYGHTAVMVVNVRIAEFVIMLNCLSTICKHSTFAKLFKYNSKGRPKINILLKSMFIHSVEFGF